MLYSFIGHHISLASYLYACFNAKILCFNKKLLILRLPEECTELKWA